MNIAIPTNDRKSIAKRTGKASEIAFYTINNGTIISVTYTKNTHSHDDIEEVKRIMTKMKNTTMINF